MENGKITVINVSENKNSSTVKQLVICVGTFLVSILCYRLLFNNMAEAILFTVLLLIHEMGHVVVMYRLGMKTASLPIFIPFMGAVITFKQLPKTAAGEAAFAIGGPVFGTVGAFACFLLYLCTGSHLWLFGAWLGFMLNLFNLIPISPLDGGRIVGGIWRGLWFFGLGGLLVLNHIMPNPIFGIAFAMGVNEIHRRYVPVSRFVRDIIICAFLVIVFVFHQYRFIWFGFIFSLWQFRSGSEVFFEAQYQLQRNSDYFNSSSKTRFVIGIAYFGLTAVLSGLLYWAYNLDPVFVHSFFSLKK